MHVDKGDRIPKEFILLWIIYARYKAINCPLMQSIVQEINVWPNNVTLFVLGIDGKRNSLTYWRSFKKHRSNFEEV